MSGQQRDPGVRPTSYEPLATTRSSLESWEISGHVALSRTYSGVYIGLTRP